MHRLSLIVVVGLVVVSSVAHADGPPVPTRMYPSDAFLVTAANEATLQSALDTHTIVRLQIGDDYSKAPAITMKSGYQLYGLASTLPSITIDPGATGVVVSSIQSTFTFPASTLVTKDNLLLEVGGTIQVTGATLEDNTILGLENGNIVVDTSAGGYLRNNRFIRVRAQELSPLLVMKGDAAHQSYNNVFLWANQLNGTLTGTLNVAAQKDLTLVGWDVETYVPDASAPTYVFDDIDVLRMWTTQGRGEATGFPNFVIGATEAQLTDVQMGGPVTPTLVLQPGVARALSFSTATPITDKNDGGFRLSGEADGNNGAQLFYGDAGIHSGDASIDAALPSSAASTLASMVNPTGDGAPWERPTFAPPPDPAGSNWNSDLASKPDSTAMIQSLLDTNGYALLPAGTYYIASSIKIHHDEFLLGSGADTTVIIAKDPSIDMIVDDGTSPSGLVYGFQFGDITLQGGTNGVHFSAAAGVLKQFADFRVSHVTFRNFSHAGFFIDQIFGLDNGLIDDVNFVSCLTGFEQYVDPAADPSGPNSGYLDKVMFFHDQFVANGKGVNLAAYRADNLNAFVDSLFQGNTTLAFFGSSQNSTIFANTDFIDNGGDPAVSGATDLISCYFRADTNGVSFLGGRVQIEGSRFERGTSTTAKVFDDPPAAQEVFEGNGSWYPYGAAYMRNSTSDDAMDLGNVDFGIYLNNTFPTRPDLSTVAALVYQGQVTNVAGGAVNPVPQLLFGSSYAGTDGGISDASVDGAGTDGSAASVVDATTSFVTDGGGSSGSSTHGCGCRIEDARAPAAWGWFSFAPLILLARRRLRKKEDRRGSRSLCLDIDVAPNRVRRLFDSGQ